MKRLLPLLFISMLFSASCKKYEDGPSASLLTKKARLANRWKVEQYLVNGVDRTYDYRTIITAETLEIFKSGSWQYTQLSTWSWEKPYLHGEWSFSNKKESVSLTRDDMPAAPREWEILRLKSTELWLQRRYSADSLVEIHYGPQKN